MTVNLDNPVVAEALELIATHERLFEAGDLDAVMANFSDDIAMLAQATPILSGKAALRSFYQAFLGAGAWVFKHESAAADVVGDLVVLHGVARGKHTPSNGDSESTFANNFLIILRREAGPLRIWRAAFMPGAPE